MSSNNQITPHHDVEGELTAPRRFKTAFIFFSSQRHKQIKEELARAGRTEKTTNIAKMVSTEWREMSEEDRAVWNEKSRIDKERYDHEMQLYNHARKLSKTNVKDPNAPRRPMSAFLAFSNKRRASLKREHPTATNADLSKMLSKAWKELSPEMKQEYVQEEAELRAKYKTDAVVWKKKKAEEAKASAPKTVSEEKQDTGHSLKLPPSNVSAIEPNASVTSKQDQSTLLASLANIQNQGEMSYFPNATNYSSSNSDLLGALHNRVYGASNSIDAAILQNLSERIRLEQQLANQQSFQLQQQLASSITGSGYPGQQQQGIHNLAQRLLANNAQNILQQSQIGDEILRNEAAADAFFNQQANGGFTFPPGFPNNGWFR
ncbi:upstream-binding transcription factor [Fistulifera solaris]|uniref:Upstream-binding transcription factor n=1 Tax=Fistulifera solaris TaxID=1519565 RepID=A0A1Z5K622_FISSO|nr:upstream-binding transcription factor [Fistulifera solaris]|eukprot:GAX21669.1 upstream-binding transcription factor [Fistulifera solaris]